MVTSLGEFFSDRFFLRRSYFFCIDTLCVCRKLVYVAFESNLDLLDIASAKLAKGGFHEYRFSKLPGCKYFQLNLPSKAMLQSMEIHIYCIPEDFLSSSALKALEIVKREVDRPVVDLIIGCCIADLVPPDKLTMTIEDMAGVDGSAVYLPISFCGKTEVLWKYLYTLIKSSHVIQLILFFSFNLHLD